MQDKRRLLPFLCVDKNSFSKRSFPGESLPVETFVYRLAIRVLLYEKFVEKTFDSFLRQWDTNEQARDLWLEDEFANFLAIRWD